MASIGTCQNGWQTVTMTPIHETKNRVVIACCGDDCSYVAKKVGRQELENHKTVANAGVAVPIIDVVETNEQGSSEKHSIIMPRLVRTIGSLSPKEFSDLRINEQLYNAVKKMHESGVIHENLHQDNIMLDENNKLYIIDFGNSRIKNQDIPSCSSKYDYERINCWIYHYMDNQNDDNEQKVIEKPLLSKVFEPFHSFVSTFGETLVKEQLRESKQDEQISNEVNNILCAIGRAGNITVKNIKAYHDNVNENLTAKMTNLPDRDDFQGMLAGSDLLLDGFMAIIPKSEQEVVLYPLAGTIAKPIIKLGSALYKGIIKIVDKLKNPCVKMVNDVWEINLNKQISRGMYGIVHSAYKDGETYVAKIIPFGSKQNQLETYLQISREIEIQKIASELGIAPRIHKIIENETSISFIMDKLDHTLFNMYNMGFYVGEYESVVLEMVSKLHKNNILHCDLHFSNIMFNKQGKPYIIDYGKAEILNNQTTNHLFNAELDHVKKIFDDYELVFKIDNGYNQSLLNKQVLYSNNKKLWGSMRRVENNFNVNAETKKLFASGMFIPNQCTLPDIKINSDSSGSSELLNDSLKYMSVASFMSSIDTRQQDIWTSVYEAYPEIYDCFDLISEKSKSSFEKILSMNGDAKRLRAEQFVESIYNKPISIKVALGLLKLGDVHFVEETKCFDRLAQLLKSGMKSISSKIIDAMNGFCETIKNTSIIGGVQAGEISPEVLNELRNEVIKPAVNKTQQNKPFYKQVNTNINKHDKIDEYMININKKRIIQNMKLSDDIVDKYRTNKDFEQENDILNHLISDNASIQQVVDQRNKVLGKIKDINDNNNILNNFTQGMDAISKIVSGLAHIIGNAHLAHHTVNTITFVSQATLIGSAYNGLGPFVGLDPFVLGLMATGTVIQFIAGMKVNKNEEMQIFMHSMMNTFLKCFEHLQNYLQENFTKLFNNLDKMEQNIISTVIGLKYINLEILNKMDSLLLESKLFWSFMHESMENINNKLEELGKMISTQEARTIISKLGHFASTVYYNNDYKQYSNYRNQLVSHLGNNFMTSNIALVNEQFTPTTNKLLALQTLYKHLNICAPSRKKMYTDLQSQTNTVYISPFMNFMQFLNEKLNKNVKNSCEIFDTYYDRFLKSEKNEGIFTIDIGNCTVIMHLNKHTHKMVTYEYNEVPMYINLKLCTFAGENYYSVERNNIKSNNVYLDSFNNISYLANCKTIRFTLEKDFDANDVPVIQDTIYHTLYKTLLYIMTKEYIPANGSLSEFTKLSHTEFNQLVEIGDIIQTNIVRMNMMAHNQYYEKVVNNMVIAGNKFNKNIIESFNQELIKFINDRHIKYVDTVLTKYAIIPRNFNDDLDVTIDGYDWKNGHEDVYNDRLGHNNYKLHNFGGGSVGSIFTNYVNNVRTSANEFRKYHLQYIDDTIGRVRKIKQNPNEIKYGSKKSNVMFIDEYVQIPFFIRPIQKEQKLVLPCHELIRNKIIKLILMSQKLREYMRKVYDENEAIELYYVIEDREFIITCIHNAKSIFKMKTEFNKKFGDIELSKDDNLWTWFCGGACANGSNYVNVENWQSHIAGNHSHKYVHVPRIAKREMNNGTYIVHEFENITYYKLRHYMMDVYKNIMLNITKPIINKVNTNNLCVLANEYFTACRIFETWDYWTFRELVPKCFTYNNTIINLEQCINFIKDHHMYSMMVDYNFMYLRLSYRNQVFNDFDTETYSICDTNKQYTLRRRDIINKKIIASDILENCMKEGSNIVELFVPYVWNGLSTPECAKQMAEGIKVAMINMHRLIRDITDFSSLPNDEKSEKIDDFLDSLQQTLKQNIDESVGIRQMLK